MSRKVTKDRYLKQLYSESAKLVTRRFLVTHSPSMQASYNTQARNAQAMQTSTGSTNHDIFFAIPTGALVVYLMQVTSLANGSSFRPSISSCQNQRKTFWSVEIGATCSPDFLQINYLSEVPTRRNTRPYYEFVL